LRIASLSGTGIPEYRRLLQNDDIQGVMPSDWSPDGRWIAARLQRKDRTVQIALVSTQDGAVRVLKSTDWSDRYDKIFFSPDGRYLAYAQTSNDSVKSQVFIMAADGSRETAADTHPSRNHVMRWAPDGKRLLFASDRNGSTGLWMIAVADGRPQGQPILVKPDIGSTHWSLGMTASGALYTWRNTGSTYVQVSPIDLSTGKLQGSPTGIFQRFVERGRPEWSADGRQLAFESCSIGGSGSCALFVWSMKTGEIREVKHPLNYFQFMNWSPNGRELLVGGNDGKGNRAIFRIEAESGATSVILAGDAAGYAQWAPDGKAVYYNSDRTRQGVKNRDFILKRDLASGVDSEMVRAPGVAFALSPDGRSVAQVSVEGSTTNVLVISLEQNQTQKLFQVSAPGHIQRLSPVSLSWTPDSRAVIAMKYFDGNSRTELWEIPVDGREPRKLDIDTAHWNGADAGFRLSPDGKHLAFVGSAGKSGTEIWAFENLTPTTRANR
jgi:Tol biopolymer transport system component